MDGRIMELRTFKTTDEKLHTVMQDAEAWQEFIDFRDWCDGEFTTSYATRGADIAEEIWKRFRVEAR